MQYFFIANAPEYEADLKVPVLKSLRDSLHNNIQNISSLSNWNLNKKIH